MSKRDIKSRFGQNIFLQYDHTPFGGDYIARMLSFQTRLYFPGFFKHHSLNGLIGLQLQDLRNTREGYQFANPVYFPRGYGYRAYDSFYMTSINYAFPVWYMDFHLGSLLNIQRIRANLFHDSGYGERNEKSDHFYSAGIELNFDFNVFRYLSLFDLGIRYAYRAEDGRHMYQLIIGSFGF